MGATRSSARRRAAVAIAATLLALGSAAALAASQVVKRASRVIRLAAGTTRTVTVPYPDALEYGDARYHGHVTVRAPSNSAPGRAPNLTKVRIVAAGSVLGGSEYEVRAFNANAAATEPVRVSVTATTVEPLPDH
jgi:hypothetical protein